MIYKIIFCEKNNIHVVYAEIKHVAIKNDLKLMTIE